MNIIKVAVFVIFILLGVFMFVYGGYDDSPGAQLLGVLLVIGGIVGAVKSWKRKYDH